MADETAQVTTAAMLTGKLPEADDATLRAVIREAGTILQDREAARKREALAQIRAIAKQHGLTVSVSGKEAGRRKTKATASERKAP